MLYVYHLLWSPEYFADMALVGGSSSLGNRKAGWVQYRHAFVWADRGFAELGVSEFP